MGYIKEPDGVDFVIKSKPLTEKQKEALTAFIKADKERVADVKTRKLKKSGSKQGLVKSDF